MSTIVFEVNLETVLRESHASASNLRAEGDNFRLTRSTHFPNDQLNNRKLVHGDQFTATDLDANYLRDNFVTGDHAFLTIISTSI